jgi:hypothetical protein
LIIAARTPGRRGFASVRRQVGPVLPDPALDVGAPPDLAHPQHLVRSREVPPGRNYGSPSAGHPAEHLSYLSDPNELAHELTVGTRDCSTIGNSDRG